MLLLRLCSVVAMTTRASNWGSGRDRACSTTTGGSHVDPLAIALALEAEIAPPDLRIRMNPEKGLVAVPTWFWVEGYDGGALTNSARAEERHEECHEVSVRDAQGRAALGTDGRPQSRRDCTTTVTTFVIDVRLYPTQFAWDFGDQQGRTITCPAARCADGLGVPFVDARHPSTVQHPYGWSSLLDGRAAAYTVQLGITFGADYRVAINGDAGGGWRSLPSRSLGWRAAHQVQEAQAVLTRP